MMDKMDQLEINKYVKVQTFDRSYSVILNQIAFIKKEFVLMEAGDTSLIESWSFEDVQSMKKVMLKDLDYWEDKAGEIRRIYNMHL